MMNFIDISSHQASINLETVFSQNPLDGVVVKSTQWQDSARDSMYVNPYCDKWVQWLIAHNKPWGFYHYLAGRDPTEEAKRFIKHTVNYFNFGVPGADYEGSIVHEYGTYYLRRFLETVYNETGVKPFVYCNLGVIQSDRNGFRQIAEDGYPLWLAQYRFDTTLQVGFLEIPWQNGSFSPFQRITMHQYAQTGRLNGYDGNLDFDKFYGTIDDWNALARISHEKPPASEDWKTETKKYLEEVKAFVEQKIKEIDNM